ncbi:uncharacterized protein NPIL_569821 [Nephila pilipes]|uniref:Uncharacterized protein n=1 Tax=Nephila pilipes TaxID=299642 RepID=A0A8X6QEM8_NEPPI|nr:uncharacterized protein NPIL_569821 [Nephila pilipes]
MMFSVTVRVKDCITIVTTWVLIAPCLLGYTQSNDPILKYICSKEIGEAFLTDLMQCNAVLNTKFRMALTTCVPTSTAEEAENTREIICSSPEKWTKMMDCVNIRLIELQDDKDQEEVSPSILYRECVNVLMQEAEHTLQTGNPFLEEASEKGNRTKNRRRKFIPK